MPELLDDTERTEYDEAQLLREAQNGDAQAFGRIYEKHAERVFRYLFAHLDNRLDAEDLTEEVFFRTWKAMTGYRSRGLPFQAFLFRVAHNLLIDHYRRSRHQLPALPIEEEQQQLQQPDPAQALQLHLERQEIRQLLGQLRQDYQTVLELRFLAELSPEETAHVMGRSPGAVRVLQFRALCNLRKLME